MFDHPAVFFIKLILAPFFNAAEVEACLVLYAVKLSDIPHFVNVALIHLEMVCAEAAFIGFFVVNNKFVFSSLSDDVTEIYFSKVNAIQSFGFSLK